MQNNTFKYLSNKQLEKNYTRSKRKKKSEVKCFHFVKILFYFVKIEKKLWKPTIANRIS